MKTFSLNSSIINGTQRFVSSTEEDWSSMRIGSSIRFGDDDIYYVISKIERLLYIKDFEVISSNKIKINDDVDINILKDDSANISFKEAELSTIFNIKNSGFGYNTGDKLFLEGGISSTDIITGKNIIASIIITQINNGIVTDIKIENKGKYIKLPEAPFVFSGGNGKDLQLELGFKVIDSRNIIERDIEKVETSHNHSIITLNYPIPKGIVEGKISVDKWNGYINSNYIGETKIEQPYYVLRDFTPYLNIPLLTKNNPYPESVINRALSIIDSEINELKKRL